MTATLGSLRALVLDDDPVYRHIVTSSLKRIGLLDTSVASDLAISSGCMVPFMVQPPTSSAPSTL